MRGRTIRERVPTLRMLVGKHWYDGMMPFDLFICITKDAHHLVSIIASLYLLEAHSGRKVRRRARRKAFHPRLFDLKKTVHLEGACLPKLMNRYT